MILEDAPTLLLLMGFTSGVLLVFAASALVIIDVAIRRAEAKRPIPSVRKTNSARRTRLQDRALERVENGHELTLRS